MKTRFLRRFPAASTCVVAMLSACAVDDPGALAENDSPIQAGQLESGFPAVGLVQTPSGFCSGTLISPNFVLTAKHCAATTLTFNTGTAATNFIPHAVDAQFPHPSRDLLLLHLTAPITNIAPMRLNPGALPAVGAVCTGVGFGIHAEPDGTTTARTKRSCTEVVESASSANINVRMVSGIADSGDSGGPLLCGGVIAGAVTGHTDGTWPAHVRELYTTSDVAWANDVQASRGGGFTTFVQSYTDQAPSLDFGLPSPWQSIAGDFNGDGRGDYARLGGTGAWVFHSNGDGSFARSFQSYVDQSPQLNFGVPSTWQAITGDFNGDGRGDYARLGGTGAWVFYGNANGSFTRGFQSYADQAPALNFGDASPWQVVTGDFNGDGRGDYARLGDTGAWVFFGTSARTFTRSFQSYVDQSPTLNFGVPSTWQVVAGDFNGDGRGDYARLGDTGAWVFYGNANGSFTRAFQSYVDQSPTLNFGAPSTWQVVAGDFNGDGRGDYARLGDTGAWVFFGTSARTFTRSFQSYVDQSPTLNFGAPSTSQVIAGDFNGDHRGDYARLEGTGAWLFTGNANGTFGRSFQSYDGVAFGDPSNFQVVVGDFRHNGRTSYARLGGTQAFVFLHQ